MAWFGKKKQQISAPVRSDAILNAIHDGVTLIEASGKVKVVNPALRRLLGISADEGVGIAHTSLLSFVKKDGSLLEAELNPISLALKNNQYAETRDLSLIRSRENGTVAIALSVSPMGTASDDRLVVIRDITRELKEEQEKNEFISTASHEMRTPVASIEGYLGLALNPQTATIDARAKEYLTKAHESSRHLGRLFRDLLDTTKLDDGRLKANFVPVEVLGLVRNIAEAQMPSVTEKGLRFLFNEPLSGAADERQKKHLEPLLYASVDIDFLREAVGNLIENAIKYTKSGSIAVNVYGDERSVFISVADTGMGIASSEVPHIFQKFYRVDNSDTRDIGGTGLGLYLTRQRIEVMRGKIRVESELGKGSNFIVALPRLSENDYQKQQLALENAKMIHPQIAAGTAKISGAANGVEAQVKTPKTEVASIDQNTDEAAGPDLTPEQLAAKKAAFAKQFQGKD